MTGKRVLIVDDEAPMRFLLSKQLNRAGFETATAANGEAALALMATEPFDAVVLDVVMPGMDGFEVCRRLKAAEETASIPVIFLSASCSGEFRRRAFRVGAADFLAKPFETEALPAYLQAIFRRLAGPSPDGGHVVAVIGTRSPADAPTVATRMAEKAALDGPGPAMLIDLELPAGSIGARLQLSGGPNMRVLLQNTGEPITSETIARVAQRYHGALEVMPAPYTPSTISQGAPEPQRLVDVLDHLVERGYYVVVYLGNQIDDLALTALSRSESVAIASSGGEQGEVEALVDKLAAAGIPRERILTAAAEASPTRAPAYARPLRERELSWSLEPATEWLAAVA